jgi:hypothetical protein
MRNKPVIREVKEKTYPLITGELTATLIFPIDVAQRCGLKNKVIIQERDGGMFIRKLN